MPRRYFHQCWINDTKHYNKKGKNMISEVIAACTIAFATTGLIFLVLWDISKK